VARPGQAVRAAAHPARAPREGIARRTRARPTGRRESWSRLAGWSAALCRRCFGPPVAGIRHLRRLGDTFGQ
jgi:hypothetical protein